MKNIMTIVVDKDLVLEAGSQLVIDLENESIVPMEDLIAMYQQVNKPTRRVQKRHTPEEKEADFKTILTAAVAQNQKIMMFSDIYHMVKRDLNLKGRSAMNNLCYQLRDRQYIEIVSPPQSPHRFRIALKGWNLVGATPPDYSQLRKKAVK